MSVTLGTRGRPLGRPKRAQRGKLTEALEKGGGTKVVPGERLTSYAYHDRGIAMLPIFRPLTTDEYAVDIESVLDSGAGGQTRDLNGYVVRLPDLIIRDRRFKSDAHPDGVAIALAAICPTAVGVLEEDLLLTLISLARAGTSGAPRSRLLDVVGGLIEPSQKAYKASGPHFVPELGNIDDEVIAEYVAGPQDQQLVDGPRYRIRCRSEVLIREWRQRSDSDTPALLRRVLNRLSLVSYLARRRDGNAGESWGGLRLLHYTIDPRAKDGRDVSVEFAPRLTAAMLGFVGQDGGLQRSDYAAISLDERYALPRTGARILHRHLSAMVWERAAKPGRGRPKVGVVHAKRDFEVDQLVEALWGPPPRREVSEGPLLRKRRQLLIDALTEINKLPAWRIEEQAGTGLVVVHREIRTASEGARLEKAKGLQTKARAGKSAAIS